MTKKNFWHEIKLWKLKLTFFFPWIRGWCLGFFLAGLSFPEFCGLWTERQREYEVVRMFLTCQLGKRGIQKGKQMKLKIKISFFLGGDQSDLFECLTVNPFGSLNFEREGFSRKGFNIIFWHTYFFSSFLSTVLSDKVFLMGWFFLKSNNICPQNIINVPSLFYPNYMDYHFLTCCIFHKFQCLEQNSLANFLKKKVYSPISIPWGIIIIMTKIWWFFFQIQQYLCLFPIGLYGLPISEMMYIHQIELFYNQTFMLIFSLSFSLPSRFLGCRSALEFGPRQKK